MSDIVLGFDQVSKRYRLRRGWHFLSLGEAIGRVRRRVRHTEETSPDFFWALRDVNFQIRRGESVGLIGSNGAGKSTTLKILSRVTVPTKGGFSAVGKIGALIEVGAGFHFDLTGRENVFLNGAIMGMTRAEVEEKFERIVSFAEIERFIDTPIKYYSSGMAVRLGFAVAAHINPDILLVDEVLAVGDAAFQAKCLNKLAELREQDKTIILVSHNMTNIVQHCDRVIWMDRGTVRAQGEPEAIVEQYLQAVQPQRAGTGGTPTLDATAPIRIGAIVVRNHRSDPGEPLVYGARATIDVEYEVMAPVSDPVIGITFENVNGHALGGLTSRLGGVKLDLTHRTGVVRLVLDPVIFTRGMYKVTVSVLDERIQRFYDFRSHAMSFSVDGPSLATREVSGHVVYPHHWESNGSRPS
ncbi:MAG TPA: ABC transporter ATP-binding protein [Methylomirabilota bacterium]|nr:ABC transporter ATP-binding protein [Methylomirabilota bacterium]